MKNRFYLTTLFCLLSAFSFAQLSKSGHMQTVNVTLVKVQDLPTPSAKTNRTAVNVDKSVKQTAQKRSIKIDEGYPLENQIKDVKEKILDIENNPSKYTEVGADISTLITHYKKSLIVLEEKKSEDK